MSNCQPSPQKSTLDGLPKQFVSAMRTLFDIMDDKKIGYVKFSEIESRWQEDGAKGLPKGVIESLRKVTPANGHLSFERFCAGLKICLLRHSKATSNQNSTTTDACGSEAKKYNSAVVSRCPPSKLVPDRGVVTIPGLLTCRPSSVPLPERGKKSENSGEISKVKPAVLRPAATGATDPTRSSRLNHANTATVRPNNAIAQQRAISMPHLQQDATNNKNGRNNSGQPVYSESLRGLRGYKSELRINAAGTSSTNSGNVDKDRFGIMTALNNWRMGMLANQMTSTDVTRNESNLIASSPQSEGVGFLSEFTSENNFPQNSKNSFHPLSLSFAGCDLTGNPKCPFPTSRSNVNIVRSVSNGGDDGFLKYPQETGPAARKAMNRRREPRRHTVANGIDYNMLKRMKQLEQERDVLMHGLDVVERAREWYLRHISNIQEKIRYGGKVTAFSESSTEAHQERLNFQMARIFEVNQHLWALIESSERGFPLHMNLAVRQPPFYNKMQLDSSQGIIQRLKEQNRMLTEEVSKKSERITQLEREKSALIRELFQSRSQHRREPDETTFM